MTVKDVHRYQFKKFPQAIIHVFSCFLPYHLPPLFFPPPTDCFFFSFLHTFLPFFFLSFSIYFLPSSLPPSLPSFLSPFLPPCLCLFRLVASKLCSTGPSNSEGESNLKDSYVLNHCVLSNGPRSFSDNFECIYLENDL